MSSQVKRLDHLSSIINVRLTLSEKSKLKEDADFSGLSLSELVRRRYFGRPIIVDSDAVIIKELRRLGSLLKHIHNETGSTYNSEISEAIIALKVYMEKLSHDC